MMRSEQFEADLEVFRTEVEAGTQFLYAYLAVHAVAGDHESVYELLNRAPLFWNTVLGALQTATFIALGRVFDQNSAHNLDRLLKAAQDNPHIFSTSELGKRKQGAQPEAPIWLPGYLRQSYSPDPRDFRRLRAHTRKWRRIYETSYRGVRDKLFAHKEASTPTEVDGLFENTNIRELQRLFVFLRALYGALLQLFINGEKPRLRPGRYSVTRMRHHPTPRSWSTGVQERITHEAEKHLLTAAQHGMQPTALKDPKRRG